MNATLSLWAGMSSQAKSAGTGKQIKIGILAKSSFNDLFFNIDHFWRKNTLLSRYCGFDVIRYIFVHSKKSKVLAVVWYVRPPLKSFDWRKDKFEGQAFSFGKFMWCPAGRFIWWSTKCTWPAVIWVVINSINVVSQSVWVLPRSNITIWIRLIWYRI